MKRISFTSFKGGVGKTTCSICLATLLSDRGPVVVVDADPNRSATIWASRKQLPFVVCDLMQAMEVVPKVMPEYLIFDTPARPNQDELDRLIERSDLIIVPCTPDVLSIGTLREVSQMMAGYEDRYSVLLNMVPTGNQTDGQDAIATLSKNNIVPFFDTTIRRYKAYQNAANQGTILTKQKNGGVAWRDWTKLAEQPKVAQVIG